jgi:hypothetical protein
MPPATDIPVWMLGSGTTGAELAARFGLPFAAAFHINAAQATAAVELTVIPTPATAESYDYSADESAHDFDDRFRSFELIAHSHNE